MFGYLFIKINIQMLQKIRNKIKELSTQVDENRIFKTVWTKWHTSKFDVIIGIILQTKPCVRLGTYVQEL